MKDETMDAMDELETAATNDRDRDVAIVLDYRARASLSQLPLPEQQAIRDALRALAHAGWDLNALSLLSVATLHDQHGSYYGLRLSVAPDVEVVLRPLAGDPSRMAVADVLNYEALRNVAATL